MRTMAARRDPAVHHLKGYITDLWVAEGGDGLVLLDGGCRGDASRVVGFVRDRLGRPLTALRLAVATHAHPDHAGGACELRRRYRVPVAAPEGIDRWYAGPGGVVQQLVDRLLARHVARRLGRARESVAYPRRLRPDHPLVDGGPVPHLSGWRAVAVPGHTAHDVVLHHAEGATLYAADLVVRINGGLRLPVPVLDRRAMSRSIERLAELEVRRLLLAHGGEVAVSNAAEIADALRADLERTPSPSMRRVRSVTALGRTMREMVRNGRGAP